MSGHPLKNRTAIVTGASSGIGQATARQLAAAGAFVYAAGRSEEPLRKLVAEIDKAGGAAGYVTVDLRKPETIDAIVDRAVEETGRLNILVNNAGLSHPGTIADGKYDHWREMFETNVLALLAGSRAAIRAMRKGKFEGHVVNVSSIAARREGSGVYGATKAAVDTICATLRQELENDPIRVTQILPGAVLTNFGRNFPPQVVEGLMKSLGETAPQGKDGKIPEDVMARVQAKAAQMFASSDDVARTILFAVTQPIALNIHEIVVRPQRSLPEGITRPAAAN